MQTLNMKLRDGSEKSVKCHTLIYTRMNGVYKLALHKSGRHWIVSEFKFGAKVCTVTGYYKGMPIASGTLPLKDARICALVDLDLLVDRIGFDKFDAAMSDPKPF